MKGLTRTATLMFSAFAGFAIVLCKYRTAFETQQRKYRFVGINLFKN